MRNPLNNVKLRDKLLLMYFISVFIPIVLTNVIFYSVTTNNVKSQKSRDVAVALEQTKNDIRLVIDDAVGISYTFYSDALLNELLDRDYVDDLEYVEAYQSYLRPAFYRVEQAYKAVRNVQLYVNNPTVRTSGNLGLITEEVRRADWYTHMSRGRVPYPVIIVEGQSFSLLQRLDNYTYSNYLKIVKIDLNMDTIGSLFQNSAFEGKLYLVNPEGRIIYTNDASVDFSQGSPALSSVVIPDKSSIAFESPYTNNNYLNGWKLHGVMHEAGMLEEVRKSGAFVIFLASLNFVIPTVILVVIARSLHVRLIRILKHMKKVKNQNFETIPDEESRDEIGQLIGEFNRMTSQIQSLIQDVYIADIHKKNSEIKQRQAQLHALHSQINPHFLFNALETIRMRSLIKSEKETARIIQNMAKIFRKSISWGRDWVSVKEELELVNCFLEIQKYRFGDKLEYDLNIQEEVYEQQIPKMAFLPFIENASIHGVETSPVKGVIRLDLTLEDAYLVFRLTDNGMGIPKEKLAELLHYLQADDAIGEHVGMKNVYTRLQICYGDAFGFHIHSVPGQGTEVLIRLPVQGTGL
jgi:two-component system, sensor histidine kinase YesM